MMDRWTDGWIDVTYLASLVDDPQHYLVWTIIVIVSSHHGRLNHDNNATSNIIDIIVKQLTTPTTSIVDYRHNNQLCYNDDHRF
jgi:hypothetical protein